MYTVLIADDEVIIRRGLKKVVNWEHLGFAIIGEAANGEEALSLIRKHNPDIVLLDIRMPLMNGLEVIQNAQAGNYKGKILILSGYSDFKYAQEAIRFGVKFYLTKPIDEEELTATLKALSEQLKEDLKNSLTMDHYREKARSMILRDLILGNQDMTKINYSDIHLTDNCYQIMIYEKYCPDIADISYNFSELLKIINSNNNSFESITIENNEVIILKGNFSINKFSEFLKRFEYELKPQVQSPLNSLFIAYGRIVYSPGELQLSYRDASQLLQRRFFCEMGQHTIGYQSQVPPGREACMLTHELIQDYCSQLVSYIQSYNRNRIAETLRELKNYLYYSNEYITEIKLFLTDLFLQIKDKISNLYGHNKIPFSTNSQIIDFIGKRYYLYEIFLFFTEQFEMILSSIDNTSRDSVIESILCYINRNYKENLKLETISPLFGYNSSYLGRVFNARLGETFNTYLDRLRIENSLSLLELDSLKIYEVAEKVGYCSVDYFDIKFKKFMGVSPKEYRKQLRGRQQ